MTSCRHTERKNALQFLDKATKAGFISKEEAGNIRKSFLALRTGKVIISILLGGLVCIGFVFLLAESDEYVLTGGMIALFGVFGMAIWLLIYENVGKASFWYKYYSWYEENAYLFGTKR